MDYIDNYKPGQILNLKQYSEALDYILDKYEEGDTTIYFIGRWGRETEAVCMPYSTYTDTLDFLHDQDLLSQDWVKEGIKAHEKDNGP